MTTSKKLLVLPGDGIGPEVIGQTLRVLDALALPIETIEGLIGGAAIDAEGAPVSGETLNKSEKVDAVLVGAVGGPKWSGLAFDDRPEKGLLDLRGRMDVYANLRPARCFSALADASSLRREYVEGLDILFVRELTGGVYFGSPRGVSVVDGERVGINTHRYTASEIRRVAVSAFELARGRSRRVCSAEKSNVMEAGLLWRQEVQALRDEAYPDIELTHILADNLAMQLVKAPKQFDLILTDNLFGDILSDEAAMLTGSLGMLPSGSLGAPGAPGLYEPIHGSAPDIAGRGIANPSAAILSLAMALRFSLGFPNQADRVEQAVERALEDGARTGDLGGALRGAQMAEAIIERL